MISVQAECNDSGFSKPRVDGSAAACKVRRDESRRDPAVLDAFLARGAVLVGWQQLEAAEQQGRLQRVGAKVRADSRAAARAGVRRRIV